MDFRRPVEAIIPGAHGRILAVLAEASVPLSVRTVARLAGVSVAQASRVLPGLAQLGIADRTDVPPSTLYRLIPEHVASRAVLELARSRQTVVDEMTQMAERIEPAPASVIVFGSFARGESDAGSDIDVLVIRPDGVDQDDAAWSLAIEEWSNAARRLTGNEVSVMEMSEGEAAAGVSSKRPLWHDVLRDGVVLVGVKAQEIERLRA
jgi:predicted nucleotidyltransferase